MKTWTFTYYFEDSDWFEWETEISDEESKIINQALEQGKDLDEMNEIAYIKDRVYEEICESFEEDDLDFDPCEGLTVYFKNPMEELKQ